MPRHIIHKQTVTLHMPDAGNSNLFQDKVGHLLRNEINDAMETAFDKVAGHGEVIRINRLELDLGTISPGNFEAEFKTRFIEELTKVLPKAKSDARSAGGTTILAYTESVMETLQYFLIHGRLPWYAGPKEMQAWEGEILTCFTNIEWAKLDNWFQKQHSANPSVTERLILQFSDSFICAFLIGIGYEGKSGETPELVYKDLYFFINTLSSRQPAEIRFTAWSNFLDTVFAGYTITQVLTTTLEKIEGETLPTGSMLAVIRNINWHKKLKTGTIIKAINNLLQESSSFIENSKIKKGEGPKTDPGASLADDFLFVQNCGIVLLNPFLNQYFDELGLLNKKDFITQEAQKRAVLLLHYLATGDNVVAEFDLTLQKIMCGLPINEPVPNTIKFTEIEKEEAEKMLRAVMQHWKPLNNTSLEGLRVTFLQREGKMIQTETGWILQVETKTVDVLLGKLPWGYSTIRLPWLKYFVHVEWY